MLIIDLSMFSTFWACSSISFKHNLVGVLDAHLITYHSKYRCPDYCCVRVGTSTLAWSQTSCQSSMAGSSAAHRNWSQLFICLHCHDVSPPWVLWIGVSLNAVSELAVFTYTCGHMVSGLCICIKCAMCSRGIKSRYAHCIDNNRLRCDWVLATCAWLVLSCSSLVALKTDQCLKNRWISPTLLHLNLAWTAVWLVRHMWW